MITQTPELPQLLTPEQAAKALRVSVRTLAVWRCRRRYPLKYAKIGRRVYYRVADINAFIEKRLY